MLFDKILDDALAGPTSVGVTGGVMGADEPAAGTGALAVGSTGTGCSTGCGSIEREHND